MHNFKTILLIGLLILQTTYAVEYNIAINKVVTTSTNVPDHPATMVNDQDLNTYVQVNAGNNLGIWILFDLKSVYNITKIIIWPTNDEADYYFARVYSFVRLTNTTAYDPNDIFCIYDRPVKRVSYNCSKNNNAVKGRYVLLKKESSFSTEILKLAEVAILTEDKDFIVPITGQVEQNHAYNNLPMYDASKAIDGDFNTYILTGQENDANRNIPGWWRTDLGDVYQVSAVNINEDGVHQPYRGHYSVYVDSSGFTKQQLCFFFNQSFFQLNSFFQLKCDSVLTGRYLTVEKISSAYRLDLLTFSEIQVVAVHKAYTLPTNYSGISTTSTTTSTTTTTTTTTKSLTPSSPTIPLLTISTTKTPSTSTTSISTLAAENVIKNLQQKNQNLETEKIVIGVVVCLITAILFSILGFVCGNIYQKKKSVKPTEATIYEKTKVENSDQHVYSDLNNTPMKEINTYYNENK